MASLTAEKHVILQEMLKVITEARQASERLSEIWAKGLANPIGPHTTHLSSPITPMTPSQSPQPPDPVMIPEKAANKSDPFIEPLERASVLQVVGSVSDVMLVHKVDSHVMEVEESPQKSTSGNGENVAHQLFDQKPERVTSKERHLKHLKGWKFKFKGKNLSRFMPQIGPYKFMERKRKRYNKFTSNIQIEPMRTRITWEHSRAGKRQRISPFQLRYDTRSYIDVFLPIWLRFETQEKQHIGLSRAERVWKPGELVFLREQWDWLSKVHNCGIIVNIARRLYGTNLSTKLFSPPLTDFQIWKKELGSLTVCSNIGLEEEVLFRKGGFIEFNGCHTHLKKLRAALERLPQEVSEELAKRIVIGQKIACALIYGDVKFHLKHKWRSRLLQTLSKPEFCEDSVILFTSSVKLLFPKNHKLLPYEAEFCAQYNDLEQLRTESQSSPGLDYFAYLIFLWNQALNCGCEAGHISYGFVSVGDVHEFFICSKFRNGDETYGKRLLGLNEISLLDNDNKVNFTINANWFYNEPMIRGVFHLQRPPELNQLIELHGNPDFITKVIFHWKEHPPDQFSQALIGKYSCFHP